MSFSRVVPYRRTAFDLAIVVLIQFVVVFEGQAQAPTVFEHVGVLAMLGDTVLSDHHVLIENGQIALVSDRPVQYPSGTRVIDAAGKYLMPGLSDMHAHVTRREGKRPGDYLAQGVTVLRNMSGEESHLNYRDGVQSGELSGPLMWTAGMVIGGSPPLGRRHLAPNDADEARLFVREQHAAGYDYIKVYSRLPLDHYEEIVAEASALGIPVVGHVSDDVPIELAIRSGISSIEHLFGYFWPLEAADSELRGRWHPQRLFHAVQMDESRLPALAKLTAEYGVWNCPTLWRKDNFLTSPLAREAWSDDSLRALGHTNRMKLVKALYDAGAGLLTGTDDDAHIIHDELALFVEAGLTPYEALEVSTVAAAEYLGQSAVMGTIEEGKQANVVLLGANPIEDISNSRSVVGVMVKGVWTSIGE